MNIIIDPQGELRHPNLHDGAIEGLQLEADKRLEIALRDVTGQRYRMRLTALRRLICDDFREGNIILSITIDQGTQPDIGVIRRLLGGTEQEERIVADTVRSIAEGRMTLVTIAPS